MATQTAAFVSTDIPYGYVTKVVISIEAGTTQRVELTANNRPSSVVVTSPDGWYSYTVGFLLKDGRTLTLPATRGNGRQVTIVSPFREQQVNLNLIKELDNKVIDEFQVIAIHTYLGITFHHIWRYTPGKMEPWNLTTAAPTTDFAITYLGWIRLMDNSHLPIPLTSVGFDLIDISPTQFGFTVKVDPSNIHWEKPDLTEVVATVYQVTADGQKVDAQAVEFQQGDGPSFLSYLASYEEGVVFYFTAEYWYLGQPRPHILPPTKQTTQRIKLPPSVSPGMTE